MNASQHSTLNLLVLFAVLILFLGVKGRNIWQALLTPVPQPKLNLNPLSEWKPNISLPSLPSLPLPGGGKSGSSSNPTNSGTSNAA